MTAAAALPALSAPPPVDEWTAFTERVRERVMEIVRQEGRAPKDMWIDPARAAGNVFVRKIHLRLTPGSSAPSSAMR
jgi:hypothetical protein